MDNSMLFAVFFIPALYLLMGALCRKVKSGRNHIWGYRTARSMSSPECWDAAQKISGKCLMQAGAVLLVAAAAICALAGIGVLPEAWIQGLLPLEMAGLIYPIAVTERRLKEL